MLARDYKIRVFIIMICFLFLFTIIAIRLFLIQIRQEAFFEILARQQHELEITLTPRRATIYDTSGKVPLAFNREIPSAFLIPQQLVESAKTMRFLKKNYPEVYERLKQNPDKQFLWLDRKLPPQKYAQLEQRGLKDVHFINEYQRFYPLAATSQLIGFTDIDNKGTAGIELAFSDQLGGQPAKVRFERDARSGLFYFDKAIQKRGQRGQSLALTVDATLQAIAYHELKRAVDDLHAQGGSVIILDPHTGNIVAMTNYPTFDPNQKSVPSLEMMKNSCVCECYELGSVMKAFCALAALEEKAVSYDELIDCEGRFGYVNGVRVENPTISLLKKLEENNNTLPFCDVIKYSSNVGIAKVAQRLGPKLYDHLRRLGFGSKTNIQFPGERSGFVNPPDRWSRPSLVVMSFGYELMATLLQLGKAFCVIANGGKDIQPTLLTAPQQSSPKKLYSDRALNDLQHMLERVCERCQIPGFRIMGKTGTARCIKDGRYSASIHNYTFAGIIAKNNYHRVVVTFIREPQETKTVWASEIALPLFKIIAQRMIAHDRVHKHYAI
jgi:cell division protein FtsI (penicillin-binding protein 3)